MKRFVKGFYADYQNDLVEKINAHAEQNNLDIVQISYSTNAVSFYTTHKALVLFERIPQ